MTAKQQAHNPADRPQGAQGSQAVRGGESAGRHASATAVQPDPPAPDDDETAEEPTPKGNSRKAKVARGECVVDADMHVGRAVNGKVCSYHAMHYDAEGNRRDGN